MQLSLLDATPIIYLNLIKHYKSIIKMHIFTKQRAVLKTEVKQICWFYKVPIPQTL